MKEEKKNRMKNREVYAVRGTTCDVNKQKRTKEIKKYKNLTKLRLELFKYFRIANNFFFSKIKEVIIC